MTFGITGNPTKEALWQPVADLVAWLMRQDIAFCLDAPVAEGLGERALVSPSVCEAHRTAALGAEAEVVLSFGGDGTLLRTAHELGADGTPILGVNIGRLGFLAATEVGGARRAVEHIARGDYDTEARMVLEIHSDSSDSDDAPRDGDPASRWALNEFVIDRSGSAGLLHIEVRVDGRPLTTYRADGLILATPTGSTAYSLSAGGPIIAPGADAMVLTPIAPHMLTMRPLVLPGAATVQARVEARHRPYVLATDGHSTVFETATAFTMQRAAHAVHLVRLPGQDFFRTLRSKLMWGADVKK